jgi:hypothetical protein
MCHNYRQPSLLIFIFITLIAAGVFIMHVNYYLSYGPMTLGQENGYYLSIAGNSLIVVVCLTSTLLLSGRDHKAYLPVLFNLGFAISSTLLIASTVFFFEDPPLTSSMQTYVLHRFIESNENTALMERLQEHHDNEKGALDCCGVVSYLDYTVANHDGSHLNVTHIHVPDTCCIHIEPGCGKNLDYPRPSEDHKIFHKGCLQGGVEHFMKRLDYMTYGFYHYIAYTVLVVFLCSLFAMASFNILYFCSEGEEVFLQGVFGLSKKNTKSAIENTKEVFSTDTIIGPGSLNSGFVDADEAPSGASTGNAAALNHEKPEKVV